ncbi:MAG: peptidase M28 [Acidobacteria bacterium]|nr:MAG: peptidase M28 [Acidobacteriota bacterium]
MRAAIAAALTALVGATLATLTPAVITLAEKTAARAIRPERLTMDVRFLASDLLEGRSPATRGDQLARAYIAGRLEGMGLQPGAPGGSWQQVFDMVGINTTSPETVRFARGSEGVDLRVHEDYIAFSGAAQPEVRLEAAEVVFVGYGIVAPEYQWDDFKGADLRGKVLLVMNNDPEDDPALFAGKTRLYYGRWDYKYDQAARQGAAGAIIIHTAASAGYKWQVVQTSWTGEQFSLPAETGDAALPVKAWATEEACRRVVRLAGQDLDALRASAQKRDFRPVPLGVTVSLVLRNEVQRRQTANVIARLPGSDPVLAREAVLYTAHHDHLGIKPGAQPGHDAIYNGALDNASGVAALLGIAEAMKALPERPRRTILFAAVAAEEQGLLGSRYLAANPPVPAGRLAADINIDGVNIWGPSQDVSVVGLGKSNLDDWIRALAAAQGREVVGDQFPDRGSFYRSDQLSLARIGVPAAYLKAGTKTIGRPAGWGREQQEAFEAKDYHQPSDELREDWNLAGAVEDAQLLFFLGVKVANATPLPAWRPGDEFESARRQALAELSAAP